MRARRPIFDTPGDYEAFERILEEAVERVPMRLLSYCVTPNHRHLVVFLVQSDENLWTVRRYVERNALRADLCTRAQPWGWSSPSPRPSPEGGEGGCFPALLRPGGYLAKMPNSVCRF